MLLNAYEFNDTESRDRLIDEAYPVRECSDIPGVYFLPNNRALIVDYLKVEEHTDHESN